MGQWDGTVICAQTDRIRELEEREATKTKKAKLDKDVKDTDQFPNRKAANLVALTRDLANENVLTMSVDAVWDPVVEEYVRNLATRVSQLEDELRALKAEPGEKDSDDDGCDAMR